VRGCVELYASWASSRGCFRSDEHHVNSALNAALTHSYRDKQAHWLSRLRTAGTTFLFETARTRCCTRPRGFYSFFRERANAQAPCPEVGPARTPAATQPPAPWALTQVSAARQARGQRAFRSSTRAAPFFSSPTTSRMPFGLQARVTFACMFAHASGTHQPYSLNCSLVVSDAQHQL
jgi:hypothetical protein